MTPPRSGPGPQGAAGIRRLLLAALVAVGPGCLGEGVPSSAPEPCTLDETVPVRISVPDADPGEWHGWFELPDHPRLWGPRGPDEVISAFRAALEDRLGPELDARRLMERQRDIFALMPPEWEGEAAIGTLILEGRAGTLHPIGCLEAMLWKWQAARYPMLEHPTEFGAFILLGEGVVRVVLSSSEMVGQRLRRPVLDRVEADVRGGYRLKAHLHNHPFLFHREVGDRMWTMEGTVDDVAGALAPSMTDVQFYLSAREGLNLEEAWVTNGLETSRFPAGELDLLAGATTRTGRSP